VSRNGSARKSGTGPVTVGVPLPLLQPSVVTANSAPRHAMRQRDPTLLLGSN